MVDEYPFADYISLSDKDIKEDRLHPREVVQHSEEMRERMDKINKEYVDKQKWFLYYHGPSYLTPFW